MKCKAFYEMDKTCLTLIGSQKMENLGPLLLYTIMKKPVVLRNRCTSKHSLASINC